MGPVQDTPSFPGQCLGNDNRCRGSTFTHCKYWKDRGADCVWYNMAGMKAPGRWTGEGNMGECLGQSNNCHYQSFPMCKYVSKIGHGDCRWFAEVPGARSSGECIGNDNVCPGTSKNWCKFHIAQQRNCIWYSTEELQSSPGHCAGSNPWCAGISKPMCEYLTQHHGANCIGMAQLPKLRHCK